MSQSAFNAEVKAAVKGMPSAQQMELVSEDYSPQDFGNSYVHFSAPEFDMRFGSDRGEAYFEVASKKDGEWWPGHMICEVMGFPAPALDLPSNLAALARVLPELEARFGRKGYPQTKKLLNDLLRKRQKELRSLQGEVPK